MPYQLGLLVSYSLDTIWLALIRDVIFLKRFKIIIDKLLNNVLLRDKVHLIPDIRSSPQVLRFNVEPLVLFQNRIRRVRFVIDSGWVLLLRNVPRLSYTLVIFQILVFENGLDIELILWIVKTYFCLGLMFETRLQCFASAKLLSWLVMHIYSWI